jgi:hypothetical protein
MKDNNDNNGSGKKMKRLITFLLTIFLCIPFISIPLSANPININDSTVLVTQKSRQCTLASAVSMIRRRAVLEEKVNWNTIYTYNAIERIAWINGEGLRSDFRFPNSNGYRVRRINMESGLGLRMGNVEGKRNVLIEMLDKHPEGIVIYVWASSSDWRPTSGNSYNNTAHAVLLTDYVFDGTSYTFYCSDPAMGSVGRRKLYESTMPTYVKRMNHGQIGLCDQDLVIAAIRNIWHISDGTSPIGPPPPPPLPLSPPQNLTASRTGERTARISWESVPGAHRYEVQYRSPNTNNLWVNEADYKNNTATNYIAERMADRTIYHFRVRAVNSAGTPSEWSRVLTYEHFRSPPTNTQILTSINATANRTSGTTADKYSYTVTTNVPVTRIIFMFNNNSTVYTLNANGTNNFNSGTGSVSADRMTWTWNNDTLGAGIRTITITAFDAGGNSVTTTLNINVTASNTPPITTTPITVSATSNRASGTVNDRYSYTITTNVPATRITLSFSGNNTLYTIHANGTNNTNAGTVSVSADRRTWTWNNDLLGAGNRVITIIAYDEHGNSATTTLRINVTN